jgi:hypothetical protein
MTFFLQFKKYRKDKPRTKTLWRMEEAEYDESIYASPNTQVLNI